MFQTVCPCCSHIFRWHRACLYQHRASGPTLVSQSWANWQNRDGSTLGSLPYSRTTTPRQRRSCKLTLFIKTQSKWNCNSTFLWSDAQNDQGHLSVSTATEKHNGGKNVCTEKWCNIFSKYYENYGHIDTVLIS